MGGVILPSPCLSAVSRPSLVPYTRLCVPEPLAVLMVLLFRPSAADLGEVCLGVRFRVSGCRYRQNNAAILQIRPNVRL